MQNNAAAAYATEDIPATSCGNVWVLAATIAQSLLTEESADPHVLTINDEGMLEAVGPTHPEYERRLLVPGFVGTVTRETRVERLAARIRAAALRRI